MSRFKKLSTMGIFVLLTIIVAGFFTGLHSDSAKDIYYKVAENVKLFGQIYQALTDRYIEEIDPEEFVRAGVNGMLDKLDPYTIYLEKEGSDELKIMTSGKYYGVGMRIVMRNGWATVAEQPFPNSPAARAGIREGDQIIEIDGQSTKGFSLSETASHLRGKEKGSEVRIKIRRVGEDEPLNFTLLRDEITVTDIEYAGFLEPGIGVIKLTRFDRTAAREIRENIRNLKMKGLDGLILDLRGNPGGLLDVAVAVADIFLDKGELIVYTKGRWKNSKQEYRAASESMLKDTPLVVLVNDLSASASEIVSGAVQDLDRGVIIGSETFGKGLVQTVVPLDRRGEKQLKITTAQYFMPSGRLIQRPEIFETGPHSVLTKYQKDDENEKDGSDSSAVEQENPTYYTRNGRVVYGGGGIKPDIEQQNFTLNRYEIELMRKSMFFNFSLHYVSEHETIPDDFDISEDVLQKFHVFLDEKEFDYEPSGYDELKNLEKIARKNDFYSSMENAFSEIRQEYETVKINEKQKSKDHIKMFLKREILGKYSGKDAYYRVSFESDSTIIKAIEILKDPQKYHEILATKMVETSKK